jgi:hypothetical protein
LALRTKVEVFTLGTAEPYTDDGLREDVLASNPTRHRGNQTTGSYLVASIALDILMNVFILNSTDDFDYIH